MGYTVFTKQLVDKYIKTYSPKSVIDLGAQNDYSYPTLPAPYISEWYGEKGMVYHSIDLSGENNCFVADLSTEIHSYPLFDFVLDIGTSEHIGDNGKFGWGAIYNCWLNKNRLLEIGGLMINENPLTGHWPTHGFQYYDESFYMSLCKFADYEILEMDKVCAMGNCETGKNIFCVLRKFGTRFPTLEEFKTLPLHQK